MTEIPVSIVTDEMVTRAYAAFMQNVTAVTPKGSVTVSAVGPDFIHPRTAIRKALEAALDSPDLDGAAAILHREPDGSLSARIGSQKAPEVIVSFPRGLTSEQAVELVKRIRAAPGKHR